MIFGKERNLIGHARVIDVSKDTITYVGHCGLSNTLLIDFLKDYQFHRKPTPIVY